MTILNQLIENIKETVPDTYMIVLGGSQAAGSQDASSDYDLLVMSHDKTLPPVSYNNFLGCADIVIRTPGTLAYEVGHARYTGQGTVLRHMAMGQIVYDPWQLSPDYQTAFQTIYQDGPHRKPVAELARTATELTKNIADMTRFPAGPEQPIMNYHLNHQIAKYRFDLAGKWSVSGKMLGRFMQQDMAYDHLVHLTNIFDPKRPVYVPQPDETIKPKPFSSLEQDFAAAFVMAQKAQDPNYIAWDGRHSLTKEVNYLTSANPMAVDIATKGLRYRWTSILNNIKPERYDRKTGEYHFALAKTVNSFATTKARNPFPGDHFSDVLGALYKNQDVFRHFPAAAKGAPDDFKNAITETILKPLGGPWSKDEMFLRRSPAGHTLKGYDDVQKFPQTVLTKLGLNP